MSGHPAIVTTDTVTIDDVLELARFRAACDAVGVQHDPAALVDHHRRNAAQIGMLRSARW